MAFGSGSPAPQAPPGSSPPTGPICTPRQTCRLLPPAVTPAQVWTHLSLNLFAMRRCGSSTSRRAKDSLRLLCVGPDLRRDEGAFVVCVQRVGRIIRAVFAWRAPHPPHAFPETERPKGERLSRDLDVSKLGKRSILGTADNLYRQSTRDSHAAARVGSPRNAGGVGIEKVCGQR